MKRCHLFVPLLSLSILTAAPVLAAVCGPDTLGTSRTLTLKRGQGGTWGTVQHPALPGLEKGEVVLTFDDGPARGLTEKVLDALKAECAHATFFMTGANLELNGDLARRAVAEGHSAGIHSYSHPHLKTLTDDAQLADLKRTQEAYRKLFGRLPPAYRFPFLEETPALLSALKQQGVDVFSIDLDITDWQPADTTDMLVERLEKKLAEKGGGIILLHDANGPTAAAAPKLLRLLKEKGYRLVHLHWAD
ncbi:polysaccharide deacetylase family protein [Niveispirillum sp. KHB5.9]|uniref:polysaccharide deacetylase family protein n=1 Tax=Niveispirillum sp. KHB5.9 TaxID=3400269 RepID=UPI003A8719EC